MRRRGLISVAMLTAALCHGADARAQMFSWGYPAVHGGCQLSFFSSGRSFHYGYWSYSRPYVIHSAYPLVIPAARIFGPAPAARMLGLGDALARPLPIFPPRVPRSPGENRWRAKGQATRLQRSHARTGMAFHRVRRGQALVALHSYKLAAQTFKHAFKLHPAWSQTNFRLDAIYADRPQSKSDHLDALAAAAEEEPTADLMLLIGAQLYYDGQPQRSLKFFRRAGELNRGALIALPPADAPPGKEAGEPKPPPKQQAPKKPVVF